MWAWRKGHSHLKNHQRLGVMGPGVGHLAKLKVKSTQTL